MRSMLQALIITRGGALSNGTNIVIICVFFDHKRRSIRILFTKSRKVKFSLTLASVAAEMLSNSENKLHT
jgi:hypothetical protein